MAWIYLVVAGLLEVVFATSLKASHGFTRLWPSVLFLVAASGSFFLLTQALKTVPVGIAYGVWTGIGAAGTALLGIIVFGESRDVAKLLSLLLLIAGIIGLRLTAAE